MGFFKKIFKFSIFKVLIILLILTVILSIFYFCKESYRKLIDSMASILAIPSSILSVIVLKVIDIKKEDLDGFSNYKKIEDSEKKINKKKAIHAFDEYLNEMIGLQAMYKKFYDKISTDKEPAKSTKNQCAAGIEKIEMFFKDTKSFIFKDYLLKFGDRDVLKRISNIDNTLSGLDDEKKIESLLSNITDIFIEKKSNKYIKKISKKDRNNLKHFFDEGGLMVKYLKTCDYAFIEIKEEEKNEI